MVNKLDVKRYGTIHISISFMKEICESLNTFDHFNPLSLIDFIPLHVECDYCCELFVMKGYSPLFDIIKAGEEIPEYNIEITKKEGREGYDYSATVKKIIY